MHKPTKRKAFSFLRSYFDVLNELPEDQKLDFLLAIINKQFLDEDPKLNGISKIGFEGVRHAVEQSVKGYKDKMKTDLLGNPLQGGSQGGYKGPLVQEKEEEKEKVQVKEKVQKSIEERKAEFKNSLLSNFIDRYNENLLIDFFEYWSEHSPKGRKMRFEKEKVFDVERRLKTWVKNEQKFGNQSGKKSKSDIAAKWFNDIQNGTTD
jgi:hypothetical protein